MEPPVRYLSYLGEKPEENADIARQAPGLPKGLGGSECFTNAGIYPGFFIGLRVMQACENGRSNTFYEHGE